MDRNRNFPKKSLGQNFFTNKSLAQQIIKPVLQNINTPVLEIGGGTGSFTGLLETYVKKLVVVEKDSQLAAMLMWKYPNAIIVNDDILMLKEADLFTQPFITFGSLPYNISKLIIFKIAREYPKCTKLYVIVQKEVAEKFAQEDNKLGILIRNFFKPKILIRNIAPGNFNPKPKVNSSYIYFQRIQETLNKNDYNLFYKYILRAFSAPRKKLSNNLKPNILPEKYKDLRAENLSFKEHLEIFKYLNSKGSKT